MNWLCSPPAAGQKVMPDDHSEVVPLLPIPNRTVKRLCADDSAGSRVKVGHRQAVIRGAPSTDGAFSSVLHRSSLDENAQSVLQCESSPTKRAAANRQTASESAKATEFART